MKKIVQTIAKFVPVIAVTVVTFIQALGDQRDSEKLEQLEERVKELESK